MKNKWSIYDKVFNATVNISIGDEDTKDTSLSACVFTVERKIKCKTFVEYLIHLDDRNAFYDLIHETVHLVKRIFIDRNIPFNETNDETIAYYQTYWFKRIWRLINTRDKKN